MARLLPGSFRQWIIDNLVMDNLAIENLFNSFISHQSFTFSNYNQ